MKAKNSLRGMLWPLIKIAHRIKIFLYGSKKRQKVKNGPTGLTLAEVRAESKRIAEKLKVTQDHAERSQLKNKYPGMVPVQDKDYPKGHPKDNDLCSWREDEEDRYQVPVQSLRYKLHVLYCDEHPEVRKKVLMDIFRADHDAGQFEQYQLENNLRQAAATQKPDNLFSRLLCSGAIILTVIFIMGAQPVTVKAQAIKPPQGLQPGDKVPDLTMGRIINYPTATAKISDFKGKLLILDFWASWCGACLGTFPKADSLQRKFEGRVQFMPVTYQDEKEARRYYTLLNKRLPINLPTVVSDTVLARLFPHKTIPHYVWIDAKGIVQAITSSAEVNEKNINLVLETGSLQVAQKKDIRIPHDRYSPLLIGNNGGDGKNLIYHSLLTGYTQGIQGGYEINAGDSITGKKISTYNQTIEQLYRVAMGEGKKDFGTNQVVFELKDSAALRPNLSRDLYINWLKANSYCYELIVPPAQVSEAYQIMKDDLKRHFKQYDVSVEVRKEKCLALIRTSKKDKLKTAGGKTEFNINGIGASIRNMPMGLFFAQLTFIQMQKSPIPVINETNYQGNVDMELASKMSDYKSMNLELAKYDLQFVEVERDLEVVVFRDNPKFN